MKRKIRTIKKAFSKTPKQLLALGVQRISFSAGKDLSFAYPPSIILEPTNACNLRCISCKKNSAGTQETGFMKVDDLKGLLNQAGKYLSSILFNGFGEPLLHPQFCEFLSLFHTRVPWVKVVFFTNGLLFTDKIIDSAIHNKVHEIIISIDSATAETYRKIRKNDFSILLRNIRMLNEAKKRHKTVLPLVKASFTIMEENRHEIEAFLKLLRSLDIEPGLIEAVNTKWGYGGRVPVPADLDKAYKACRVLFPDIDLGPVFSFVRKPYGPVCPLPFVPYVAWNGDLKVCCYMPLAADYPLGNVFESSFRQVWLNKKSRHVRSELLKKRFLPFCSDCMRAHKPLRTIRAYP
ncbi:MAG: radical SAM protein [Candidatus Omnitrophota bacterium]|nr:radical SAM protein [Candidatus Omnitrophota bacterium]